MAQWHDSVLWSSVATVTGYTKIAFVTFLLVVVIRGCYRLRKKYKKNQLLYKDFDGPPAHWLFGNVRDAEYGKGIYKGIELIKKYGPALVIQIGPIDKTVVFNNPKYIQTVLNTSEPKDRLYELLRPWIGEGLLLSSGKKWSRNRRLLTPAFHFDILKPYQQVFSQCAMVMVNKWKKHSAEKPGQSLEMFENVSLMTLDSLMKCIFGVDENFQEANMENPYIRSVYALSELTMKRARFVPHHIDLLYYFSYSGYKFRKAINMAHAYSKNVIEKRKMEKDLAKKDKNAALVGNKRKYLDFLDTLLDCRDEDGKGLTDQEIQDEVDTFMFEGHDTTASGLSWCLYNMARHPDHQEKCRQEVQSVLGDRTQVTWEDLSKFSYLTMCIKESLRLFPPVPTIGRTLTKTIELPDGRQMLPGTNCLLSMYSAHHNPLIWHNPEIFDPERFLIENSSKRHTHAFVVFSAGPRNCIGQNFAMNELKTTMALVLKHYKLYLDGSKPVDPLPELILRSKGGVWLSVEEV